MKRYLTIFLLAAASFCTISRAQIYDMETINKYMTVNVKLTLEDRKDKEPIGYASVYLIPEGDTTITHFAISDPEGKVAFDNVISGRYQLNAEMIGYHPFRRVFDFSSHDNDLGAIRLEINKEYIDASTITAVGNPITVKKDTIEYNASSFKVGADAVLGDLLKKMPGMEVNESGEVSVNGEKVDRITVGGRTFFFDDPSMAVQNLPAKIVDKVRIFDKVDEDARRSGIARESDKEKHMDVQLKEEYKKGVFGNLKLGVGYALDPRLKEETHFDRSYLYDGTAMMAAYGEKDQLTVIARGQNFPAGDSKIMIVSRSNDKLDVANGLASQVSTAANYNTARIPGTDATVSVKYGYSRKEAMERSNMTSYLNDGGEMVTDGLFTGTGDEHNFRTFVDVVNQSSDRYHFKIQPSLSISRKNRVFADNSSVRNMTETLNSSSSSETSETGLMSWSVLLNGGLSKIGGKDRRTFNAIVNFMHDSSQGNSIENSILNNSGSASQRFLGYDKNSGSFRVFANLSYSEPFSDELSLNVNVKAGSGNSKDVESATDLLTGKHSDYLSSGNYIRNTELQEHILLQYSHSPHNLQAGFSLYETYNETAIRSLGVDSVTGKDEWLLNWSPSVDYQYKKGSLSLNTSYSGTTTTPSGKQLSSVLELSDPVNISTGNIYLKPSMLHSASMSLKFSASQTYTFLNFNLSGHLNQNKIVSASWYDSQAIRYSIPVNSRKPAGDVFAYLSFNQHLGKKKNLSFSVSANFRCGVSTGYQALGIQDGFNVEDFDYTRFMGAFWGNPDGDLFYGGKSGFAESNVSSLNYNIRTGLKYKLDNFSTEASYNMHNNKSVYSLNPRADVDVWNHTFKWDAILTTANKWELQSDLQYVMYRGHAPGFGEPELIWNLSVAKTFKGVTLSLKGADLFNSTRNLNREVEADFVRETYNLVIGRYVMFSVVFNFGKMNAKQSQKAAMAMWRTGF